MSHARHAKPTLISRVKPMQAGITILGLIVAVGAALTASSGTGSQGIQLQQLRTGGTSDHIGRTVRQVTPTTHGQYVNTLANHKPSAIPVQFPYSYTVRSKDTLSSIAASVYKHADAWTLVYFTNHLTNTTIYTGEHLKIVKLVGSPPAPPALPKAPQVPPSSSPTTTQSTQSSNPQPSQSSPSASAPVPVGSLQAYAQQLFGSGYSCIASVINVESGWNIYATNPSSGAYGIPQALPGYKMASAGADWATNGYTQLRWMLGYVDSTYGGACGAWAHEEAYHNY